MSNNKVLLLSTYELGHQPFNLASPFTILTEAGIAVDILDTSIVPLSATLVKEAWFIAISTPMHTATRLALPLIEQIRNLNREVYVCCYGLYAFLNADYLLEHGVDFVIGGEYEEPLFNLIMALKHGQTVSISGVTTASVKSVPHLAKIAFIAPNRNLLPSLKHYAHLEKDGNCYLAGYVEASRGCLHTCLHCPITPVYKGRFFVVPYKVVLADIATQVELGATHITFGDPDFLNGPGHSLKILRAMHQQFPQLSFDCTIKIEHILKHQALLAELKRLGCIFIVSAVESFNDEVLLKLNKGHTRSDIKKAVTILNEVDIPMRPSLVAFTPWTTLQSYLDTLEQIEVLGLIEQIDLVQYSIRLLIPPYSALITQANANDWLGPLKAAELTYQWQHPDPRMDVLHYQVGKLITQVTKTDADIISTFYQLKALVLEMINIHKNNGDTVKMITPESSTLLPSPNPISTPKLTEAWFC